MKVVYSSMNILSLGRGFSKISGILRYLLFVPFFVAIAFGSYKVEHPQETVERNIRDAESIRQKREVVASQNGGAVYTRWGRSECALGSEEVYKGVAGGTFYDNTGGGSNYLCLPMDPIWGVYNESVGKGSKLYGSEYQETSGFGLNNNQDRPLNDYNVPCVVCRSQTKTSVVVIPARNQCYLGWHTEYTGYLMSGNSGHGGRTEFVCMDGEPESDPSGFGNENGALFYNVEGVCGSLPCPPYVPCREITCAVCTK